MPIYTNDTELENMLSQALVDQYNDEAPRDDGIHVSDLLVCMRRPFLLRKYSDRKSWSLGSVLRMTLGRALEVAVGTVLLPVLLNRWFPGGGIEVMKELEVKEGGLLGHIDFGLSWDAATDDLTDFEVKSTYTAVPDGDPTELFVKNWYWEEQAATYAVMRRKTSMRFIVVHLRFPFPVLKVYKIEWTKQELRDHWRMMMDRRGYVIEHEENGTLPVKTPHTKFCDGCPVEVVCNELLDEEKGE